MPKEKTIILGHSGFVGWHLYCKLRSEPVFDVRGFSSNEINLLNLGTYQKLANICDEKTTIIMADAIIRSKRDDFSALNGNIQMVINLAKLLSHNKIKHLIYTSTVAIYGKTSEAPITETSPANPDNFYSSAKACCELILKKICEKSGIALTTLRMGKIYGKGDMTSPIYIFSKNIISGQPIEIYGDGSHRLYPVHQNDLLSIVKRIILEGITGDYNIIPSNGITLLELIKLLFKLSNRKVEIKFESPIDPPILLTFDTSKLKTTFDNFPSVGLEEGLKEYFTPIIP